jgi:hypothetical protein
MHAPVCGMWSSGWPGFYAISINNLSYFYYLFMLFTEKKLNRKLCQVLDRGLAGVCGEI